MAIRPRKRVTRAKWRITGTAFVFGKFKKFGFTFKRVVPIKIDMLVKNPLNLGGPPQAGGNLFRVLPLALANGHRPPEFLEL